MLPSGKILAGICPRFRDEPKENAELVSRILSEKAAG